MVHVQHHQMFYKPSPPDVQAASPLSDSAAAATSAAPETFALGNFCKSQLYL